MSRLRQRIGRRKKEREISQPRRMPCNDAAHPGGRLKRRRSPPSSKGPFSSSSSVSPLFLFSVSFSSPHFLLYLCQLSSSFFAFSAHPFPFVFATLLFLSSLDPSFYLSIFLIFPHPLPRSHLSFLFPSISSVFPLTVSFHLPLSFDFDFFDSVLFDFSRLVSNLCVSFRARACVCACVCARASYIIIQD